MRKPAFVHRRADDGTSLCGGGSPGVTHSLSARDVTCPDCWMRMHQHSASLLASSFRDLWSAVREAAKGVREFVLATTRKK